MLSFCRLPLALLSRGAGSLLPRGFGGALTQLRIHLSLVTRFAVAQETVAFRVTQVRCCVLQHKLVGNGFIRSACYGFDGNSRSGNRKNRIGIGVCAPLKKRIYPFRVLWFRRQFPVGIPQKMYRHNVNAPLKKRHQNALPDGND